MFTQLTLDLQLKDSFTFDNLVPGQNQLLIDMLKSPATESEQQLYIWGPHNSGKTHLLQALCQRLSEQKVNIAYLPMLQMVGYSADVFQGLENIDVVCIDNLEVLEDKADWQEAMFDLINRMRENHRRLILTARQPPRELKLRLRDLVSRLQWGPVFRMHEMDDEEKCQALKLRAAARGFELEEKVGNFLLKHYNRDIADLFEMLETLDKAQLQQQRRITIPFVKSVLGS